MAWRWWNGTLLFLVLVLFITLSSLPTPALQTSWHADVRAPTSYTRHAAVPPRVEPAEPVVPDKVVTQSEAEPPESEPDTDAVAVQRLLQGDAQVVSQPAPAVLSGGTTAKPYVVLGVATAPRNRGHRTWIRETWMTLPNVAARTTLSFFVVRPAPRTAVPAALCATAAPRARMPGGRSSGC